jgi:hypothetical protein
MLTTYGGFLTLHALWCRGGALLVSRAIPQAPAHSLRKSAWSNKEIVMRVESSKKHEHATIKRDADTYGYIVRFFESDKHNPARDYETSDRNDAVQTALAELERV